MLMAHSAPQLRLTLADHGLRSRCRPWLGRLKACIPTMWFVFREPPRPDIPSSDNTPIA